MLGSFFVLPSNSYGGNALTFALSVVFQMLPLAALIVASLLDGLMRQRAKARNG